MSFTPLQGGIGSALSGVIVEPSRLIDTSRLEERRPHGISDIHAEKDRTLKYSMLIVIISAIIFITIISIFDVLRALCNNYFATLSLNNPDSSNKPEDIRRTEIANRNQLYSNLTFSGTCIGIAVVLIAILILIFHLV